MQTHAHVAIVLRNTEQNDTNAVHFTRMEESGYRPHYVHPSQNALDEIERIHPLAVCFQFDQPELRGLAELRRTKERLPAIPLIMITQAHSESLAVWAFRTGVWDFFVQPVDLERFLAVLNQLAEFCHRPERRRLSSRPRLTVTDRVPPEVRMRAAQSSTRGASLELALTFVERNLHRKILQAEVAAICGLSPFQFSRLFKRQYHVTFQAYVLQKRISEAMRMLHHPDATVTDVCFNVGFSDLSHFARTFQRYVGKSPSLYRLSIAGSQAHSPPGLSEGKDEDREPSSAQSFIPTAPTLPGDCEASDRRAIPVPKPMTHEGSV